MVSCGDAFLTPGRIEVVQGLHSTFCQLFSTENSSIQRPSSYATSDFTAVYETYHQPPSSSRDPNCPKRAPLQPLRPLLQAHTNGRPTRSGTPIFIRSRSLPGGCRHEVLQLLDGTIPDLPPLRGAALHLRTSGAPPERRSAAAGVTQAKKTGVGSVSEANVVQLL